MNPWLYSTHVLCHFLHNQLPFTYAAWLLYHLQQDELAFGFYACEWPSFALPVQRHLLFMMQHAQRPMKMRALLVDMNLRTFLDVSESWRGSWMCRLYKVCIPNPLFLRSYVVPTATSICCVAAICIKVLSSLQRLIKWRSACQLVAWLNWQLTWLAIHLMAKQKS